jgi:hypothetical protein
MRLKGDKETHVTVSLLGGSNICEMMRHSDEESSIAHVTLPTKICGCDANNSHSQLSPPFFCVCVFVSCLSRKRWRTILARSFQNLPSIAANSAETVTAADGID